MIVELNNEKFLVNIDEFNKLMVVGCENLNIKQNLGLYERIISLMIEISQNIPYYNNCAFFNITHGGFIPIKCSQYFNKLWIINNYEYNNINNIIHNIQNYKIQNISIGINLSDFTNNFIFFSEIYECIPKFLVEQYRPIVITNQINSDDFVINYKIYTLSNTSIKICVPFEKWDDFLQQFHYFIDTENDNILNYDNLINLCIMVKNGGDEFVEMLINNLNIIDRWTILDTGSTDNTVENIKKILVGKKKGTLIEEPFINFRDSRNRCLDIAGLECKFNLMLDDTFTVKGELRNFLTLIRGDQYGNSYSLTIKSPDYEYQTNRITKSHSKLRYIYKLHEVIQLINNVNVLIPKWGATINDNITTKMRERTVTRSMYDLKCLYEMIDEDPHIPRHLYYVAQTYEKLNMYDKAAEYYYKRAFFITNKVNPNETIYNENDFREEKWDSLYYLAHTYYTKLKKPWKECEYFFKLYHEWSKRPDGHYIIALHYFTENDYIRAFEYFKLAYSIGFPNHLQFSLRPSISYYYIPYYLAELCYIFKDFNLGFEATELFLKNNTTIDNYYNIVKDYNKIYKFLINLPPKQPHIINNKPIFCIVADGGYTKWSGSNIYTTGVGGSETWAIEISRNIKKIVNNYEVIVFCNCEKEEILEGVRYISIFNYLKFITENNVQECIISRFSEYIPVSIEGNVENIHIILHDIHLSGNIIPINSKIKNIFCLTEWHKNKFIKVFPQFTNIVHKIHLGINFTNYINNNEDKIPYSFIYSSFPNRGLSVLLKLWPKIIERYPTAILNIFTDIKNEWVNITHKEEINEVKQLLESYKNIYQSSVINHGWVSKQILSNFWKKTQIWVYPCIFKETFCLTALEAALTKTLAITNNLAALEETVSDRGIIIEGNPKTESWQNETFHKICFHLDNPEKNKEYIDKNYEWALKHSWENIAYHMLNKIIPNELIN